MNACLFIMLIVSLESFPRATTLVFGLLRYFKCLKLYMICNAYLVCIWKNDLFQWEESLPFLWCIESSVNEPHRSCHGWMQHGMNDSFRETLGSRCTRNWPTFYSVPWRYCLAVTRGRRQEADCHIPPNPELLLPGKLWAMIHLGHNIFMPWLGPFREVH